MNDVVIIIIIISPPPILIIIELREEVEQMGQYKLRIRKALEYLGVVEGINEECRTIRKKRFTEDLVRDVVEEELFQVCIKNNIIIIFWKFDFSPIYVFIGKRFVRRNKTIIQCDSQRI